MNFPTNMEPYGTYKFSGYRKYLYNLAQGLGKNKFNFKIGLILRKLTLQNRVRIVDADPLGMKARFYPMDNLGDRYILFLPKFFEEEEFRIMKKYLKSDSVFIDIGANAGLYSIWAANKIEKGRILAFEPNPIMVERMKVNIAFNEIKDKIQLFEFGLADEEDEFELQLNPTNMGGASIMGRYTEAQSIKVKCYPLYQVLKDEVERIDVLKIDIEGADAKVMKAFFDKAPKHMYPKIIFIESDETLNLELLGYKRIGKTQNSIYELT